jgi:hypothetical protein
VIFASAAAIGAGLAARIAYYGDHAKVSDVVSSAFVTGPVAAFLVVLWAINMRLHDSSLGAAVPFGVAAIALIAVTFVPYSELWAGVIFVVLLVAVLRRTPVSAST